MILEKNITGFINSNTKKEFEPFYVYDSRMIRDHCRIFQQIPYQNKAIHFASMANINPHFLRIVKEENVHIFVNSPLHLQAAIKAGFSGNEIVFTASAMTEAAMRLAESAGVQLNLDSPGQLRLWQSLFPGRAAGIRCNIGDTVKPCSSHAGFFIGKESRLGFSRDEIERISDKSAINGLHLYIGTDIFDLEYFFSCYRELANISMDFPKLSYLNFGGGFGVSERGEKHFDFDTYNIRISELMEEISEQKGVSIRLILEPGRIIGGEAGFFVCRVTDIKIRDSERLIGVNASTVQFSRPLLYPDMANHPVAVIRDSVQLMDETHFISSIYGCSTYSRDIFSKKIQLAGLQEGDIIVFGNAGSYSASSHSHFLGFPKAEEYFI